MILRIIFLFISITCNSQNRDGFRYSVNKPILSLDSLENLIEKQNDSLIFYYLKTRIVTNFIIQPKEFKKLLYSIKLNEYQKKELSKIVQIQYDWYLNKKNKDIESLFWNIYERDQHERRIMTECFDKTKNRDSCKKSNNLYEKMMYSDSINHLIVDSIAKTYGFPKQNWLGKGSVGFDIFIHHHKDIFNQNYELFVFATKNNYFTESKFRTLEDFKLLSECKNQKYNTVFCAKSIPCTPCQMNAKCCEK